MSDREELLAKLNAGRGDLLAAVEGLTDAEAAIRPPDGGWTPLECLEHVATVETLLLRRLQTQSSVSDAVGAFLDARERTLHWLATRDFDLRRRAVEHPALGPASAYEFVLIMAAHPARHAAQIQETRAAL